MSKCNICGKPRSPFVMNNKTVCLKCDELLFDLEIECEETDMRPETGKPAPVVETNKKILQTAKK